jgi:MerR family transcriptional regulator, mercuric resistance operon regulatory protein
MNKASQETFITIGKLSKKTGVNIETVRYYEKIELIPKPYRSEGGNRLYNMDQVKRLAFIKRCRELGFPLDTIRGFLKLVDEKNFTCAEIADISQHHLEDIRAKIKDLKKIESHMKDMLTQCNKNNMPDCAFIDILFT